jgi:hypothetical protein
VVQDAESYALKIGVVAGNEKPVTDFAADSLDRAKRRQVEAETCVGRTGAFRRHGSRGGKLGSNHADR